MASFEDTMKIGGDFEDFFLKRIKLKYHDADDNKNKDDFSYYDIILCEYDDGSKLTVECKNDLMGFKSGNVLIEVGCNRRLSGLSISKANYWFISDGKWGYIITPSKIRECIANNILVLRNKNGTYNYEKYKSRNENILERKDKKTITYCHENSVKQENDSNYKEMNFYLIPNVIFAEFCSEVNLINEMKYDSLI